MTPRARRFLLLALAACAPLSAQVQDPAPRLTTARAELARRDWKGALELATGAAPRPAVAPTSGSSGSPIADVQFVRYDPEGERLAALFAVEPPPASRAALDAPAARYHGMPGGIVLGLRARPTGALSGASAAGARLEPNGAGRWQLCLADGRAFACPPIEPATLRACARFASDRSDSVVDLCAERPRLAPAFAGSLLEAPLVAFDRAPHRRVPELRAWKSVIVDRDVRLDARGAELVLAAELEVRGYDRALDGAARSVLTLGLTGAAEGSPTAQLANDLAPLSELAGWIGLLRWLGAENAGALAPLARASS